MKIFKIFALILLLVSVSCDQLNETIDENTTNNIAVAIENNTFALNITANKMDASRQTYFLGFIGDTTKVNYAVSLHKSGEVTLIFKNSDEQFTLELNQNTTVANQFFLFAPDSVTMIIEQDLTSIIAFTAKSN